MGKKDYDKAIADFDEVLRLDPNNANALNDRGETYIYKQSYQRAFEDYDELTQVAPKNWRGFNGRGVARHLLGNDAAKSISDYQRASQLNPSHPWPWINLCEAHITLDQTALALEECAKANELAASPIGFFGLGIAHLKRRELGPAITAFDEALKIHPTYAKALYGRGLAKKGSGGSSEGERDIAGALSIDPNVAKEIAKFGIKP